MRLVFTCLSIPHSSTPHRQQWALHTAPHARICRPGDKLPCPGLYRCLCNVVKLEPYTSKNIYTRAVVGILMLTRTYTSKSIYTRAVVGMLMLTRTYTLVVRTHPSVPVRDSLGLCGQADLRLSTTSSLSMLVGSQRSEVVATTTVGTFCLDDLHSNPKAF